MDNEKPLTIKCNICRMKRTPDQMGTYKSCVTCRNRAIKYYHEKKKKKVSKVEEPDPTLAETSEDIEKELATKPKANSSPKYSFEQYGNKEKPKPFWKSDNPVKSSLKLEQTG
ncbi:MAG: hypothetical protein JSS53_08640, partial [Proteobacteria bacterium]|nr:hypothetical protein [Pseudomonadota bacterium]